MNKEVRQPKASEKLESLEKMVVSMSEQLNNTSKRSGEMELIIYSLSRENEIIKDALQLLHDKLDAVIAISGGELTSDNIEASIVSKKVQSLKDGIDKGLEAGNIKPADVVSDQSLIVSRETDKDGEVQNPRLQFMVGRLSPQLASKFVGKLVGDLVKGEEDKLDIEIMEIYNFVEKELSPAVV